MQEDITKKDTQEIIVENGARVWIVYRTWWAGQIPDGGKKVEYIVSTEEKAMEWVEHMRDTIDSKFGIATQEWILDD